MLPLQLKQTLKGHKKEKELTHFFTGLYESIEAVKRENVKNAITKIDLLFKEKKEDINNA